jgi:hypothetical protein
VVLYFTSGGCKVDSRADREGLAIGLNALWQSFSLIPEVLQLPDVAQRDVIFGNRTEHDASRQACLQTPEF